jgi:DNA invertase Pin-like site-specific DNA recombinase
MHNSESRFLAFSNTLSQIRDMTQAPPAGLESGASGSASKSMTKVALYARVSTDGQQKEGTIESQLVELRKQVAAAGHELVKEYIDDGYSGSLLDRPGLDQLRADAKSDVYDGIYFLRPDRIAREVEYQQIVVAELLKHGKKIIINGEDYEYNPENKLTLIMFGAFAEFERAKIIERTTRGRLHRLRRGEMSSNGQRIYGYDYVRRTDDAPATLAINEQQAAVVRSIFEMFGSGNYGLVTIVRYLETNRIPTRTGGAKWDNDRIKTMLKNETYAGVRYFNRMTRVKKGERKVGLVLTQDPDRLSRDLSQLLALLRIFKAAGIRLEFVTETGRNQYAWHHLVVRALADLRERKAKRGDGEPTGLPA